MVLRGGGSDGGLEEERPWVKISERIVTDLIDSANRAMKEMELGTEREEIKLTFVARTGKVLFLGNSVDLETIKKAACAETDSRSQLHKLFYSSVPSAYRDDIQDLVVPKAGFEFDSDKEHYHVKVFDNCQPGSTLSCKCTVVKDNQELQLQKVELNQVRHLVADISCLPKDLDLRLMLCTKKILKNMDEEESDGINKLISSAIIDPDVKGGLRWPLGKEYVAGRFSIVGVWHTNYKAFKSGTAKLYLRHTDRFDHRTSVGEVYTEIMLKLTGISKHLREDNLEKGSLVELLEPTVELIWNHFLTNTHPMA